MNRRDFVARLLAGASGAVIAANIDLEQLLWTPGEKTFFIPEPKIYAPSLSIGDVFTIDGIFAVNPLTGLSCGHLQYFIATANVKSGATSLDLWPGMPSDRSVRAISGPILKRVHTLGTWA